MRPSRRSPWCLFSLALAVAGCGDDPTTIVDAPPGPDAPSVDGSVGGVVTLTVTRYDGPLEDVPVYFQNADASLVLAARTDANGFAQATMAAGGYVTAFLPPQPKAAHAAGGFFSREIRTFAAVKPGDHLRLGEPVQNFPQLDLTFTPHPSATDFEIVTTCGSSSTGLPKQPGPITTTLFLAGCPATIDFLIFARDSKGGLLGVQSAFAVAIADNQPVTLPAGTWQPEASSALEYRGLPADSNVIDVYQQLVTPRGPLWTANTGASIDTPIVELGLTQPLAPAATFTHLTDAVVSGTDGCSSHNVVEWGAYTGSYAFNGEGVFLPLITGEPTFDHATRTVTWPEAAGGVAPHFAWLEMEIGRPSLKRSWDWEIVAPRDGAAIGFPVLPTDLIDFNPLADDDIWIDGLTTIHAPGGYDAARADALLDNSQTVMPGPSGRVVLERYEFCGSKQQERVRARPRGLPRR